MHPLGTYLAITDRHREYGGDQSKVRVAAFARVDAMPLPEPEPTSRIGRRAAILRRRILRTAGISTRPRDGQRPPERPRPADRDLRVCRRHTAARLRVPTT